MRMFGYIACAVVVVGLVAVGCGKTETPPSDVEAVIAQKTCPVMTGNPIDKNIFVEYKGEKVYFCCEGCPDMFKEAPEKYLSKLDTWCTMHDTFKSKCECKP